MVSKKSKKTAAKEAAATTGEAEEVQPVKSDTTPKTMVDVDIDADDDYEEFTPVETE